MKKLLNSLLKIPEIRGNWIIRTTSNLNTQNEETMMATAVRQMFIIVWEQQKAF